MDPLLLIAGLALSGQAALAVAMNQLVERQRRELDQGRGQRLHP